MRLDTLLQGITTLPDGGCHQITGLSLDSRHIQPGEGFIALKGSECDGRTYISHAIRQGARAILCEQKGMEAFEQDVPDTVPLIGINDLASTLPVIVKRFYEKHSSPLSVTGVTGTNGKTMIAYLLGECCQRLGVSCGVVGTVGVGFVPHLTPSSLTSLDIVSLYKAMQTFQQKGASMLAMEVSSHALNQGRATGVNIESAIFTNLTHDHLDYHGTMEAYCEAKLKLFRFNTLKRAIINAESSVAKRFILETREDVPIYLYTKQPSVPSELLSLRENCSVVSVKQYAFTPKGLKACVLSPWGECEIQSPLLGEFNLSNILAVLTECALRGFSLSEIAQCLQRTTGAPGRMEQLGGVSTPKVIIDFAHTPDALENALRASRLAGARRLWCVFGCGGGRDQRKRALMGNIAAKYADRVVLTNDNPRFEEPEAILHDIMQGIPPSYASKVVVEQDRGKAIEYALSHALAIDTILIAGKGHETTQTVRDAILPFNDAEKVKQLLNKDNKNDIIQDCEGNRRDAIW